MAREPAPQTSQTLSRGIHLLELLSTTRDGFTIDELAENAKLHRSITYRLLRTLEEHGLCVRDSAGRVHLGVRLASLAAGVERDLTSETLPELTSLANEIGSTCFLMLRDHSECITLVSAEPRQAIAPVAQRPGSRHSVFLGAPGKAILSQIPDSEWADSAGEQFRAEVWSVRERGFATSANEVMPSVRSVAVPLEISGHAPASIATIFVASKFDDNELGERLAGCAKRIRIAMIGR